MHDKGMARRAVPWLGLLLLAISSIWLLQEMPGPLERSTKAPRPRSNRKGEPLVVVLDAGHGGADSGTMLGAVLEKDLALDVALRAERLLRAAGYTTRLTRKDDRYLSLPRRAALANREKNSLFVSIHFNEGQRTAASGVETYFSTQQSEKSSGLFAWLSFLQPPESRPLATQSESLARFLQAALVERTQATNRGTKAELFYVITHVRHPAALIEGGFLTNPADVTRLTTSEYRESLARAISEGIGRYREAFSPNEPTLAWASAAAE